MREERTDWQYEPSVRTPTTRAKTSEPPEIFPFFFALGELYQSRTLRKRDLEH